MNQCSPKITLLSLLVNTIVLMASFFAMDIYLNYPLATFSWYQTDSSFDIINTESMLDQPKWKTFQHSHKSLLAVIGDNLDHIPCTLSKERIGADLPQWSGGHHGNVAPVTIVTITLWQHCHVVAPIVDEDWLRLEGKRQVGWQWAETSL